MARPHLDFDHQPTRGSEVELWVKGFRDQHHTGTPWFDALDDLLDDYRARADRGVDLLDDDVEGS